MHKLQVDDIKTRRSALLEKERDLKHQQEDISRRRKILKQRNWWIRVRSATLKPLHIIIAFIVFMLFAGEIILENYVIHDRESQSRARETKGIEAMPPPTTGKQSARENQNESVVSGYEILVPSDPNAQFFVLEKSANGSLRTITTKRVSAINTSYSKRAYDCSTSTVKYIGSGNSWDAMNHSIPDSAMGPIVNESIAYYVGLEACK